MINKQRGVEPRHDLPTQVVQTISIGWMLEVADEDNPAAVLEVEYGERKLFAIGHCICWNEGEIGDQVGFLPGDGQHGVGVPVDVQLARRVRRPAVVERLWLVVRPAAQDPSRM